MQLTIAMKDELVGGSSSSSPSRQRLFIFQYQYNEEIRVSVIISHRR
jgi:hypothetical protein